MAKMPIYKVTKTINPLTQSRSSLAKSINLFRWIGYGFLILTLLDFLEIFIPLRFMNPVWEFQMMGALVEQVPVSLLGFGLVFLGKLYLRSPWERLILKFLSWITLLFAVGFFLLIPLGIFNTVRINRQNVEEINAQTQQQVAEIEQVKLRLGQAATKDEILQLVSRLDREDITKQIEASQKLEVIKIDLTSFLSVTEGKIKGDAQEDLANRRMTLFKRSIKWNLGASIAGTLFFTIWRSTRWARLL
jgi:hypothetical protein